jgi:NADPH:quinone reductase
VLVGLLAGAKAELELGMMLHKRATIVGTVLRARPLEQKIAAMRSFETNVVPLFAKGRLKPIIDTVMPLADAAKAHAHMASNAGFGKIVLTV